MKRSLKKAKHNPNELTPLQAVRFLEDMRLMQADLDEPTVAISIRIPANILRAIKAKAKAEGKKYQTMIIEAVRRELKGKPPT